MSGIRHLFDACGVEIEYALVDRVLQQASGSDRLVDAWQRGDSDRAGGRVAVRWTSFRRR